MLQVKQGWLLQIIQNYIRKYGYPPSIEGLADTMNVTASVIENWLLELDEGGYLTYTQGKARGIRLVERAS